MEHRHILDMMDALRLSAMHAAFETICAETPPKPHCAALVAGLFEAELAARRTRSVKFQMARAHLPATNELDDFTFVDTLVDEARVRQLAAGTFLQSRRNITITGAAGSGKTHLAVAIARGCIRGGARGRFETVPDLACRLEREADAGRHGHIRDEFTRLDFLILDELNLRPAEGWGAELLIQLLNELFGQISLIVTTNVPAVDWPSAFGDMAAILQLLTQDGEVIHTGRSDLERLAR